MSNQQKEIFAFISYSHHDVKWAKWLRRRLEWYRLPSEIHNEFEDSRYIRPVFRDRDELNAGILNDELRTRLEASKYLIVICSPNAAKSQWVSDEVKAFIEMDRLEYIIPFIVNGEPQNYDKIEISNNLLGECLPLALRQWNKEHPNQNLLGINIFDDGKSNKYKAFIRLVSRMLDVQFDTLWKRHQKAIRLLSAILTVIITILVCLSYWFMVPVNLSVTIKDEKSSLPSMENGTLFVNGTEYNITKLDTTIETQSLPGYYRLKSIPVCFIANRFYNKEQKEIQLTAGLSQEVTIAMHRDKSFAVFRGTVIDVNGKPLPDVKITIDGKETSTDSTGTFSMEFPVSTQSAIKAITLQKTGFITVSRNDECPSLNLRYILRRTK